MKRMETMKMLRSLARKSVAAAFTLILVVSALPLVADDGGSMLSSPEAEAQTSVQAPVTINRVNTEYSNVFSVHMVATRAMSMTRLTINTSEKFGTNPANEDKALTINGKSYPVTSMSATQTTLTVSLPAGVEVQPGTPIVVRWRAGQARAPSLSSMTATMQGTQLAPPEPPATGNPTEAKNYRPLPNDRFWDTCNASNGLLISKTWWDNSENTRKNGGKDVGVVEVKVNGVTDLANKINTADPRLQLRFGSAQAGWTELKKGNDYQITVSGNSVYFKLNRDQQRADSSIVSYDVEARIPLSSTPASCQMTLWHQGPEWFDRDAKKINVNAPETPREQLKWLPASSANPSLPQRCGGKIALVFDTSDSIAREEGLGVAASRDAGLQVIDALQGTGSQMAIYNFASAPKSIPGMSTDTLSLNEDGDVEKLRNAVKAIAEPFDRDGRGGTNFEAGLSQVPSGEFDVVYFISDGLPTTSKRDYPLGFDVGTLINQSDLSAAVNEANRLKDSGTRIETVMVGFEPVNEHILKDDYFGLGTVKKQRTPNTPQAPEGINKPWPKQEGYGYPSYYGQADFVRDIVTDGKVLMWDTTDEQKVTEYDITNQPEIWRAGVRNTKTIGADISSEDAVTTVGNFKDLVKELSDLVLKDCFGSINVTKLVYGDGDTPSPGEGWTFDTSVDNQEKVIIGGTDGSGRASNVTDVTGDSGSYGHSFDQSDGKGQSVTVVEHQQDGYKLRPENGKNAVCTKNEFDAAKGTWTTSDAEVRNKNDDPSKPGFGVDVPFRGIVNCTIANETVSVKIDLSVEKVGFDNKEQKLEGAEFTLYKVNSNGTRDPVKALSDTDLRIDDLQVGATYELVETKSPQGYQLLHRPVVFDIKAGEDGRPTIELEGGAEQYPEVSIRIDEKEDTHSIIQVADIRKGDLPVTGGRGLGRLVLLGSFLAVAAAFTGRRARI
ncbi:SpaA isopeptide-forming pilin-related protein [Corynebacterium sp. p3-SID1194]|uniref:SpaA isopeptide-forming pilin-related protein n=1 Tax=Corynebacterium sp. p3-SID1194 TaxID=2916105 RepID=UPI0021A48179|nr:SpaA isopeptide-forming pilin-related protein [Corynebacterium sp. p3-SID1194]MCT1451275.1 SpaA isopeptide-forming pilin-related protein [Corynebacterium sp. p3-SID1194]